MKQKYFAITWNLDVICVGNHNSFDEASEYIESNFSQKNDVLYISTWERLNHLRSEIKKAMDFL